MSGLGLAGRLRVFRGVAPFLTRGGNQGHELDERADYVTQVKQKADRLESDQY